MPKSSMGAPRAQRSADRQAWAARSARNMVESAFKEGADLHVFSVPDFGPPVYMTFTRSQAAEAVAWTTSKLAAGEAIFRSETGAPRGMIEDRPADDFHA